MESDESHSPSATPSIATTASQAVTSQNGTLPDAPRHVAIIMDGNARWAKQRRLSTAEGHRAGYKNIERVLKHLHECGVKEVTLFAFSTENWNRPDQEVDDIMRLASEAIDNQLVQRFHKQGVRLRHIGSPERLDPAIREKIRSAIQLTARNNDYFLNLAFDYGSREEIVNAARRIAQDRVEPENIDEALFASYLYTAECSDPDLIIRTGGEFRISNFMLWQSAYSEFYSTKTLWPALGEDDIDSAIRVYQGRHRRFGARPK